MNRFFKTVLLTALFAGTMDLISAYLAQWIKTGKYAGKMLNYIAGGALGLPESMPGGNAVALCGLFFHYFIATFFTLLFFVLLPRVAFLRFNKYLVGMLYAVFVDVFVGEIILPLSRLPTGPFNLSDAIIPWMTLGVVLGIPVAVSAYRYYRIGITTAPPVA